MPGARQIETIKRLIWDAAPLPRVYTGFGRKGTSWSVTMTSHCKHRRGKATIASAISAFPRPPIRWSELVLLFTGEIQLFPLGRARILDLFKDVGSSFWENFYLGVDFWNKGFAKDVLYVWIWEKERFLKLWIGIVYVCNCAFLYIFIFREKFWKEKDFFVEKKCF